METRLARGDKQVIIGPGHPLVIIGERINPTGNKKLAESLSSGSMEILRQEARQQVLAGAEILDINIGGTGFNEVEQLRSAVLAVMETVDVPVCIDSSNPEAIAAALAVCEGKAIVNSVNGKDESLETILPIVKEYNAAVIGLVVDENGIPGDPESRVAIAGKIIEKAESFGIPREDVLIDCLAMSMGSDAQEGFKSLETIRKINRELGVNTTIGASNISFGLPEREIINGIFLSLAVAAGLTSAIADAAASRIMVSAGELILGRDDFAARFIKNYRNKIKNEKS